MKKNTALFFLLFFSIVSFGQTSFAISYGENITLGKTEPTTSFTISSPYGTVSIQGSKINDYKFEKPGDYTIKVFQKKSKSKDNCETNYLPDVIFVKVSRIRMKFEESKIEFSTPIRKGIEASGITMNIPIIIATYDHKPIELNYTLVNSAGIGTSITATLAKDYKELNEGEHIVSYSLQGKVTENSYLMFDFIDANTKIQSVALQSPIQN